MFLKDDMKTNIYWCFALCFLGFKFKTGTNLYHFYSNSDGGALNVYLHLGHFSGATKANLMKRGTQLHLHEDR